MSKSREILEKLIQLRENLIDIGEVLDMDALDINNWRKFDAQIDALNTVIYQLNIKSSGGD